MSYQETRPRRLALLGSALALRFKAFVANRSFPCVGAKSAMNRGRMEFGLFDSLASPDSAASLCAELATFSRRHPEPGSDPVSFVAMFRQRVANEDEFHSKLWTHLQAMHDVDSANHAWDESVSADPADKSFSFSVASRAFFVVGLHPKSSRMARQAPFPCLVFNFHDQFEAMRANGKYEVLQKAIRTRDVALQGDINPVLARFGEGSEAAQYSGNARLAGGVCPFKARAA
jgi:FPC/CPF motif-containing protein YcgG